jgi:hypothetical protein
MADAQPLSQHFLFLMLPGDLLMVWESEDFTQLLELCSMRNGSRCMANMVIMRKAT